MPHPASLAQFEALMSARWSCRGFLPEQIPDETIEKIVRVAQNVPSWCNAQPWQLLITRGDATERFRAMIKTALEQEQMAPDIPFPEHYTGVYQKRRRECGWQLYDAVGVNKRDHAASRRQLLENYKLFDAPHVTIVTTEAALGPYGVLDCGAFVSAFMLAARAVNVASIAQAALAAYAGAVRAHFDIAATRQILCGISFGRANLAHPANSFRTTRASPDEVIDWR